MSEIVLVIGYNGGGKTSYTKNNFDESYYRINRDELGGRLIDLPKLLEAKIQQGCNTFVLDNTYASIESRKGIIDVGKKYTIPVKCIWLNTSFEDAQFNACKRMVQKYNKLPQPEDFKKTKDPNTFPPAALFNYRKTFEKPTKNEGFSEVIKVNFEREFDPTYKNKALILDYDGTLRKSNGEKDYPLHPNDVEILPNRKEKLNEYKNKGYKLLGVSNQSGIAKGFLTDDDANKCFIKTNELLGFEIEYYYCCHNIPPVKCYCRKPHPGLGVYLIEKHKLNPLECIFVGDQTTDETFAKRCYFQYQDQASFFG